MAVPSRFLTSPPDTHSLQVLPGCTSWGTHLILPVAISKLESPRPWAAVQSSHCFCLPLHASGSGQVVLVRIYAAT
eukprot:4481455-Amphidinium_carterae.1